MRTAIRYFSKFGHSKQMAEAIQPLCGETPQTVDVPLTEPVDLLFLGAGVMLGRVDGSVGTFIKTLQPNMVGSVVLFGSSAIIKSPVPQMQKMLEAQGVKVDSRSFSCRGAMGPLHSGHPDTQDIEKLKTFTKQILGI